MIGTSVRGPPQSSQCEVHKHASVLLSSLTRVNSGSSPEGRWASATEGLGLRAARNCAAKDGEGRLWTPQLKDGDDGCFTTGRDVNLPSK
eukprot:5025633-Prymnesium_polylepis.2